MYDVAPKISEAGKPIFMYNIDDLAGKLLAYIKKHILCIKKHCATFKVFIIPSLYLKHYEHIYFLRFWVSVKNLNLNEEKNGRP